ncbi:MAG: endonuclease III [Desulfatibacillaceae bacterium]
MPPTRHKVKRILEILKEHYPLVRTQLDYKTPFQLLISTILSAQCTDRQVNSVTPKLFDRFPGPRELARADLGELETIIHPTGFFHSKAKRIRECAKTILERHDGEVPADLDKLVELPGVGRKTANVVLGAVWDIPGIVVDTHVKRISNRLGLTGHTDPERIERDLMEILPKKAWNDFSLQLIYHGRALCRARKPRCESCPLQEYCDYHRENRQ